MSDVEAIGAEVSSLRYARDVLAGPTFTKPWWDMPVRRRFPRGRGQWSADGPGPR